MCVSAQPAVCGPGDMMRERERDVVTLELTLGHNLGSSTVHPLYCTVLYRASSEDEEGDQDDD